MVYSFYDIFSITRVIPGGDIYFINNPASSAYRDWLIPVYNATPLGIFEYYQILTKDISANIDPARKAACSSIVTRYRFTHEKGTALTPDILWGFREKRHFRFLVHGGLTPAITMIMKFKSTLPMDIDISLNRGAHYNTPFFQRFLFCLKLSIIPVMA